MYQHELKTLPPICKGKKVIGGKNLTKGGITNTSNKAK